MEKSVSPNKMLRTEVEVRDRISDLPDSLLILILSSLPAKEAVATSLLSKRWRPLWRSLLTLDLDFNDFHRLKFFHQFVDKMLKFVDLKSFKKFVPRFELFLRHRQYFRPGKVSNWINAVITNKVEHLEIYLSGGWDLPSSVFTAKNLKVLKLIGSISLGALSHVDLPLLEVLHLEEVEIRDRRSLGMLLSACALLKDLVLKYLYELNYCTLDIGRLNHLVTVEVPQRLLPLEVLSDVTFLRLHQPHLSLGRDIPTFRNLTFLEFNHPLDWKTTLKYLQCCPKLEILVIHEFVCREKLEPRIVDVPQCVSSNLKEFHLRNYQGWNGEFDLARFIMKNALVLRIISITKDSLSMETWKNTKLKTKSLCPMSSVNCKLLLK